MRANGFYFALKKVSGLLKNIIPYQLKSRMKESMIAGSMEEFFRRREEYRPDRYLPGVNLIGSIRAEMGLGQSCRLVAGELKACGCDFSVYNVDFNSRMGVSDTTFEEYISEDLPHGVNLFHVNPCELGNLFMSMPEAWQGRYNIAFWLWELEEFPEEWVKYCSLFDEIWTPSEFAGRGIRKVTQVPVRTMPYGVEAPYDPQCTRATFGLPEDQFLYLVMYDSNSTRGRKNPQGAIDAYRRAFPEERPDCGLVIKINNAQKKDLAVLRDRLKGYQNVYFITEIMDKRKVNSLIRNVDVYLSLHRAEGFGLVMAEAMLLGTPVVATNWSSNTEFMTERSACMVNYELVKNPRTEGLYRRGCIWAEPDLDDAARYIRRLKEDQAFWESKRTQGLDCVTEKLNSEKNFELWKNALCAIIDR